MGTHAPLAEEPRSSESPSDILSLTMSTIVTGLRFELRSSQSNCDMLASYSTRQSVICMGLPACVTQSGRETHILGMKIPCPYQLDEQTTTPKPLPDSNRYFLLQDSMALNALPYFACGISVHPQTLSTKAISCGGIIHALHGFSIFRSFSF